jgi:hypothetical protein
MGSVCVREVSRQWIIPLLVQNWFSEAHAVKTKIVLLSLIILFAFTMYALARLGTTITQQTMLILALS